MRILLVGAGGVGTAFARIAARRPFAELIVADYDLARAQQAAAAKDTYTAVQLDARDEAATAGLLAEHHCDVLMNATDPRFVMPLFRAALAARVHYLDMAMSLSQPHPAQPYEHTGVKLGDEQFALAGAFEAAGKLALAGIGVEPGLSDVFARYAADELFSEIDEIGVRDGANLAVAGYDFAPTFSIWTTIEECLNPPVIWEGRPWLVHHAAVQRTRNVHLPGGHRPGRVRERRARGSTADSALGRGETGDLQVRARRGVHRRPGDAAQAWPRLHPAGQCGRGCRLAA